MPELLPDTPLILTLTQENILYKFPVVLPLSFDPYLDFYKFPFFRKVSS